MSDIPKVSVVIPTHNRALLVERALASVRAQTYQDLEVIVVDDGSTDDTRQRLAAHDDIEVIHLERNVGGGAARNRGIERARGEYVAFLDSDDEWLPHKLERQVEVLEENPKVGAVYCRHIDLDDSTELERMPDGPLYRGDIHGELLAGRCPKTVSLFLVRKEALDAVGGFDESLPGFQDTDLWLRLSRDWLFEALDEPLAVIHEHRGERVTRSVERRAEALDHFLSKWGPAMEEVMGPRGLARYRRTHEGVALGAEILSLVSEGRRFRAGAEIPPYLIRTRGENPIQAIGLIVAVLFGMNAHTRLKRRVRPGSPVA